MSDFFKSVKFKIIICIIALLIGIMIYSVTQGGYINTSSGILGNLFKPVQKLSNSISTKVEKQIEIFVNAKDYYNENQELKKQITEYYNKLIDYENVKTEIEELRKFVGIKVENEQYELSPPCSIIGRIGNDPFGSFIIDRGSKDEIEVYDPVVTGDGLVGVVVEVAESYSVVKTILSPEVSFGGICVESKDTGIIEGSVDKAIEGHCQMIFINKENNIQKGNLIVTSGNSGRFPQEYIVGTVIEVGIDDNGLSAYAVIQPAVDVTKITSVIVIKSMSTSYSMETSADTAEIGDANEN